MIQGGDFSEGMTRIFQEKFNVYAVECFESPIQHLQIYINYAT